MKKYLMLIGLMLSAFLLHAQTYYAMMVTDAKTHKPLIGATIKVKATGNTVTTSENGNVVVSALPTDSLQISFKGYKDREISLVNQAFAISIEMTAKPQVVGTKPKKKKH